MKAHVEARPLVAPITREDKGIGDATGAKCCKPHAAYLG